MTNEEFLKKFPRPWTYRQTDPTGTGLLVDANDYPLVYLSVDIDYNDENEDADEPAFQIDDDHAEALVSLMNGEDD